MFNNTPSPRPQQVKKFYFLDYFFILLQSCEHNEKKTNVFKSFRELKDKARLGESKYKRLLSIQENLSKQQITKYHYTFDQVILEASDYGLITHYKDRINITTLGESCLVIGKKSKRDFFNSIFKLMEDRYFAFYHLVQFCYEKNTSNKNGLLIFPIYSPRKLGFEKSKMKTHSQWYDYIDALRIKLENDLLKYLEKKIKLNEANQILLNKLEEDEVLNKKKPETIFNQGSYNAIIGRIRKYWLNYFLQEIYKYEFSFDTFNLWVERGKQIGIIHSSEVYPEFDGRLIFPTSIITEQNNNPDLVEVYKYLDNKKLYLHTPNWERVNSKKQNPAQNSFVEKLYHSYYDLKRTRKTHFVRLSDLREKVCYKMRIPTFVFDDFLDKTYKKNLRGELAIQISLEADRLPHETNAMYLKREPVLVNGQYKNIIAIDYK